MIDGQDLVLIRFLIAKWRESHKRGWHDQECCVNDLLDELEAVLLTSSPNNPQPLESK